VITINEMKWSMSMGLVDLILDGGVETGRCDNTIQYGIVSNCMDRLRDGLVVDCDVDMPPFLAV